MQSGPTVVGWSVGWSEWISKPERAELILFWSLRDAVSPANTFASPLFCDPVVLRLIG